MDFRALRYASEDDAADFARRHIPTRNRFTNSVGVEVRCRPTRWRRIEDFPLLEKSITTGFFQDGVFAGRVSLRLLKIQDYVDGDDLASMCDAVDQSLYLFGEAMRPLLEEHFDDLLIPGQMLIEGDSLRMVAGFARDALWAPVVIDLVQRLVISEGGIDSVLALQASPLEYRRGDDEQPLSKNVAFRKVRRQRAMVRHYSRVLGAIPFDAGATENPWLFRIISAP